MRSLVILVLFSMVWPLSEAMAAPSPELSERIRQLPPLPEAPPQDYRGVLWSYDHALRDLHTAIKGWLNFTDAEKYSYAGFPEIAPDPTNELTAHLDLYERLLRDYAEMKKNPDADRYTPYMLSFARDGEITMPQYYSFPLNAATSVYTYSLQTNLSFKELLTVFYKEMWDHRFISTFFFTTTVDPRHRPLESITSLTRSSVKARKLVEGVLRQFRTMIDDTSNRYRDVTTAILNDDGNTHFGLWELDAQAEETWKRITYLKNGIYRAAQYANDILRDRQVGITELEGEVAKLGDQLALNIGEIAQFKAEKSDENFRHRMNYHSPNPERLSDAHHELRNIFGIHAHVAGITLSDTLLHRHGDLPYQMYKDTVITQYILATGSLMAKILDTKEGRGGLWKRLGQEYRYQRARLAAPSSLVPTGTGTALVALDVGAQTGAPTLHRRNFAAPELAPARAELEDKLWRIFFEHAKLTPSETEHCQTALLGR